MAGEFTFSSWSDAASAAGRSTHVHVSSVPTASPPSTPALPQPRSRRWCAGWTLCVVAATGLLALLLRPLPALLVPALVGLQLVAAAVVLTLLDTAAAGRHPPPHTTVAGFLAVASGAAGGACGGVSGIAALMFALAGWPGDRLDLVRGILLVVAVGVIAVALGAFAVVGALRRYAAAMRLQPRERFFAFLAGLAAMGIAFLVLLQL